MWIVPAATVFSGTDQWAVIDAAVSNDLFIPNHNAPDLDGFEVIDPKGNVVEIANGMKGKFRTTFDVPLEVEGTYRIFRERSGIMATWQEGENRKRWRGTMAEYEALDKEGKEGFRASKRASRVETIVTLGAPTTATFEITGEGLEFVPVTHPNDLYAEEGATFKFYLDGKPWTGGKVTVIPGGDRYRNTVDAIELETGNDGSFTVKWPKAGRYWLEASAGPSREEAREATGLVANASYVGVFEVLPL
jgi:uncharacterized GH25 family protein